MITSSEDVGTVAGDQVLAVPQLPELIAVIVVPYADDAARIASATGTNARRTNIPRARLGDSIDEGIIAIALHAELEEKERDPSPFGEERRSALPRYRTLRSVVRFAAQLLSLDER
jgi:hypothetical protein